MKKLIILLCFFMSLNCNALFTLETIEDALKKHQEAFKKFRPEAKDVKVHTYNKYYLDTTITTYTYKPTTPNLRSYLHAFKILKNTVRYRIMLKALLIGFLVGFGKGSLIALNKERANKSLAPDSDGRDGHFILMLILSPIFTSIGMTVYDNSTKKPEPYFDPYTIQKYDNFFGGINGETIDQYLVSIFTMYGAEIVSGLLTFSAFDTILNKNKI